MQTADNFEGDNTAHNLLSLEHSTVTQVRDRRVRRRIESEILTPDAFGSSIGVGEASSCFAAVRTSKEILYFGSESGGRALFLRVSRNLHGRSSRHDCQTSHSWNGKKHILGKPKDTSVHIRCSTQDESTTFSDQRSLMWNCLRIRESVNEVYTRFHNTLHPS